MSLVEQTSQESAAVLAVQVSGLDSKIEAMHTSLRRDIGEVKADLKEVRVQTQQTNGRVTRLEAAKASLKAILFVLTAATPFLLFALQKITG